MYRSHRMLAPWMGLAALVFAASTLQAQSITISPTNPQVGLNLTRQFSASVNGEVSSMVTWSVGPQGSASGTIDATGLYKGPAVMPGQNPVTITATATTMTGTVKASTYVLLLTAPPTLTAITPNPVPSGTSNVTATGSGFIAGARIMNAGVALSTAFVNANTLTAGMYLAPGTSTTFWVINPGSTASNVLTVPVAGTSSGGGGSGGGGGGGGSVTTPVVSPAAAMVVLGATQQFSAPGATSWTASAGSITNAGLYTAPAAMPASSAVTINAINAAGSGHANVTLINSTPPTITGLSVPTLPLGVFSVTVTGTGFIAQSVPKLGNTVLAANNITANTMVVSGFAGTTGMMNLTVSNGPIVSAPFSVQVGVANPQVSASAARRFLEQAAFGPTPSEADHVQAIGFQAWLTEQFQKPVISNYNGVGSQGGMPTWFLANAVTNGDQLRQRVSFALSEIFVTSIAKLIWNGTMVPYQQMLLADAFTSYPQLLSDVTLSPAMGYYLDMANNAKANPAANTVANENYAREVLQLFSVGTFLLNQDGTQQVDALNQPIPTYNQFTITEFARVFTGWTFAPMPGQPVQWNSYLNNTNSPMVPVAAMHDAGAKTLLNGYVSPSGISPLADLQNALNNIGTHPNVAPFISKQLIQRLVKSNPTPAYVARVSQVFTSTNGDMKAIITAILLDTEARANDAGGGDLPTDGHLQEPALFLPGIVRAFGGQMTTANYYASDMASMGEDIFTSPSVFNYFSPGYTVAGTGGLKGPEFQIDNPNSAILRENLVANLFNQYSNPIQSYGPGTTVDLTPFLALAAVPATLVDAVDLTLTHGTMPAAMKQTILNAVIADANSNLHRVQTAIYLTLQSSYYNVWH